MNNVIRCLYWQVYHLNRTIKYIVWWSLYQDAYGPDGIDSITVKEFIGPYINE